LAEESARDVRVEGVDDAAELSALFRDEVVVDERARYQTLLDRARARGEIGAVTPLFADIPGSVIFTRSLIAGEPLDHEFLIELVDNVLLPLAKKDLPNGS
jgi:hypothetical protein